MMKRALYGMLLAAFAALAPSAVSADYLYSAVPPEMMPRVMLVIDNSGSMNSNKIGGKTRMNIVKETVNELLPTLDGVELGLIAFTDGKSEYKNMTSCGVKQVEPLGSSRETLREAVNALDPKYNTPITAAMKLAREQMAKAIAADPSAACRKYFVILLSDGEDNCGGNPVDETKKLRSLTVSVGGVSVTKDVQTFVVGFGDGAVGSTMLNNMARAGGTAVDKDGNFVCPQGSTSCNTGSALSALTRTELKNALRRALEQVVQGEFTATTPIVATVPTARTEVDRVARNFMAYPSFRMPGRQGHLYGIRLYAEAEPWSNAWEFTDFTRLDLDNCGYDYKTGLNPKDPANPCIYDAGRMLTERVKTGHTERKIYTGAVDRAIDENGGFTLSMRSTPLTIRVGDGSVLQQQWQAIRKLARFDTAFSNLPNWVKAAETTDGKKLGAVLGSSSGPTTRLFEDASRWLHGVDPEDGRPGRNWDLGDIYHSSPAFVEPPPQSYTDRGYPRFRAALQTRPQMIYVGANDGMIHAFHAGPDVHYQLLGLDKPRWQPGEEAWAYLPVNMITRALATVAQGDERFTSMDLSCRVDDVQIDTSYTNENCDPDEDPKDDKYCGWRSVLVCGEGWGGNWYVALDVSEPLDPKPLWEFTSSGPGSLGRTWSVPSVALVDINGSPRWLAVFGSGYNSDSGDCFLAGEGGDQGGSGGSGGAGGSGGSGGAGGTGGSGGTPEDLTCGCTAPVLGLYGQCNWSPEYQEHFERPKCTSYTWQKQSQMWRGSICWTGCTQPPSEPGEPEEPEPGEDALPPDTIIEPANPLGCSGAREAYHWLNFPYDGDFADHGNGTQGDRGYVWAIDMGTGRVVRRFDARDMIDLVADIPILDVDLDGLADIGYVGGWNGELARLVFPKNHSNTTRTDPDNWKLCQGAETFTRMAIDQPITSRPSAFADPYNPRHVFVFVGAGVDVGLHLDENAFNAGNWEFRAFYVEDDGSSHCPPTWETGNLCADSSTGEVWQMASLARQDTSARLIGAPIVVQQGSGVRQVYYTTWDPPDVDNVCGEGVTAVACMRLTRKTSTGSEFLCSTCPDLADESGSGSGTAPAIVEVDTGRSKPTTPAVADGQVYLVTDKGPMRLGNQKGKRGVPRQNPPQVNNVSWRETF